MIANHQMVLTFLLDFGSVVFMHILLEIPKQIKTDVLRLSATVTCDRADFGTSRFTGIFVAFSFFPHKSMPHLWEIWRLVEQFYKT